MLVSLLSFWCLYLPSSSCCDVVVCCVSLHRFWCLFGWWLCLFLFVFVMRANYKSIWLDGFWSTFAKVSFETPTNSVTAWEQEAMVLALCFSAVVFFVLCYCGFCWVFWFFIFCFFLTCCFRFVFIYFCMLPKFWNIGNQCCWFSILIVFWCSAGIKECNDMLQWLLCGLFFAVFFAMFWSGTIRSAKEGNCWVSQMFQIRSPTFFNRFLTSSGLASVTKWSCFVSLFSSIEQSLLPRFMPCNCPLWLSGFLEWSDSELLAHVVSQSSLVVHFEEGL